MALWLSETSGVRGCSPRPLRPQALFWLQEEKGKTEDEMVGWHHQLDGHEFEQALGVGDEQGSLACCSPWGRKELDTTERLQSLEVIRIDQPHFPVTFWKTL